MTEQLLPLFPLQVVLFPQSILPLHIFEERYKQLIGECLEETEREFGINLVTEAGLARVGCTAVVADVLQRYDDGRLDILVEGRRRFELSRLMSGAALYSVGHIRWFDDVEEAIDRPLALETVALHNQLVEMVYRQEEFRLEYDPANAAFSFKIAQKAGMELAHRQRLLEMNSENERLRFLREYFVEVIPKLERLSEVERIIKSDGYIIK
jgi:Lon protease-like protein